MAFQTKSFVAIVASMINRMRRTTQLINDYEVGSVARTLIEAPAQEIDELYQQMVRALIDAIAVSVYNSFNFSALPPMPASGLFRVTVASSASPVTIYAGTAFVITGGSAISYVSTADTVIPAGSTYRDVLVAASIAGSAGNIPSGQTFTASPAPANFVSAGNAVALVNGADAETEDQRKVRFQGFISTLARGTVDAVQYGALTTSLLDTSGNVTERVMTALVVEPYLTDTTQPPSKIFVYVHNGVGSTSSALVAKAQQIIYGYIDPTTGARVPGWSAAGVLVIVAAAADQPLNVTGIITPAPGYSAASLVAAATSAIDSYVGGLTIGTPYLASQAARLITEIPGISNWTPISPIVDVPAANNVKLLPGTVTLIGIPLAASLSIRFTAQATFA